MLDFWTLLAGLGIFLFGMNALETAIKNLSGKALKEYIRSYTDNYFRAISTGCLSTAILQSSSAVGLMVLAFAGAGIMQLPNALAVVLGANLGTTFTAWIVATFGFKVNIDAFALPLIAIGGIWMILFSKNERGMHFSHFLFGFGFLFLGLNYMKVSVEDFAANFELAQLQVYGSALFLIAGLLLTAVLQSSSATIAIILTSLHAGLLDFQMASLGIVGANVGTTSTIIIGSIGGTEIKKRIAAGHLIIKTTTALVVVLLLPLINRLCLYTFPETSELVLAVAFFHTVFNIISLLIFVPLLSFLAKFLIQRVKKKEKSITHFIQEVVPEVPEAGLAAMKNELTRMTLKVMQLHLKLFELDEKMVFSGMDKNALGIEFQKGKTKEAYVEIKTLQSAIFLYGVKLQNQAVESHEGELVSKYLHASRFALAAAKSLKDVEHEVDGLTEENIAVLTDIYHNMRKDLLQNYMAIVAFIRSEDAGSRFPDLWKLFKELNEREQVFVNNFTKKVKQLHLSALQLSGVLNLHRAYITAQRHLIFSLRDIYLDSKEVEIFEHIEEK